MPLDVLGRTRATLTEPTSSSPWPEGLGTLVKLCRAGDRALQLLLFNEECLVSACHQHALITSLPLYLVYRGLKAERKHPASLFLRVLPGGEYIGDTLKLREPPKAFTTKRLSGNAGVAELIALGMVKT